MDYKRQNIFWGWICFIAATVVYFMTIEPTTSFWDCGEFIATAYKQQVTHPPGAPFFMFTGRLFSMLAPSPEYAAQMVNILSALCSSLTILFLFWSITALAKKFIKAGEEMTQGKTLAIMASGFIGAMAYAFSDSFWFSAVEAEVYAMSSLFTAVVFWAILKWESVAHREHETRWIILIAFLVGLSIGVHLLNLLAIPAIALVYYFKKYEFSRKGLLLAFLTGVVILASIQYFIIPQLVNFASKFELLFVNSFGLPFNSGAFFFGLILIGAVVAVLLISHKRKAYLLNLITLCFTVILIGYSTFAMIMIRSSANTPMDMNNPENFFALKSYLDREQYGDRPLLSGEYWNTPVHPDEPYVDGKKVYMPAYIVERNGSKVNSFHTEFKANKFIDSQKNKSGLSVRHEYIVSDPRKEEVKQYDPKYTTLFPRMYSPRENHIEQYKKWSNYRGDRSNPIRNETRSGEVEIDYPPTFGENIRFFVDYQLNWMYFRYFFWNFSGRQNDVQGHGDILDGNWITGVKFIDSERLGNQYHLPKSTTENKGHNKFYLLPFILGIIGLLFHLMRDFKGWIVVALLFFMTGIAIVIYLNQYPLQPRERDYSFVGSFYAFAIWIGLGVYALYDAAKSLTWNNFIKGVGIGAGAGLVIFLFESTMTESTHFLSYTIFYITAIMAIAVGIMMVLGGVIPKEKLAVPALIICLIVPGIMAAEGWDDHDRSGRYTARDYAKNYLSSLAPNAILFTNGDNDTFPLWYVQEVEGYRTDVRVVNLSLLNTDWYINQIKRRAYDSAPVPLSMPEYKYRQGTRDVLAVMNLIDGDDYIDVRKIVRFISNDENSRELFRRGKEDYYLPTRRIKVPASKDAALTHNVVSESEADKIQDVEFDIKSNVLMKNQMVLLDLLATNNWERPIYFAVTTGPDSYLYMQDYFQLEGLAYRLIPVKTTGSGTGRVAKEIMYDNMMNKFVWGGVDVNEVYMDENNVRMTTNIRLQFSTLAEEFIKSGEFEKAKQVLDKSMEVLPAHNVPLNRALIPTVEAYYKIDDYESADALAEGLLDVYLDDLEYYISLDPKHFKPIEREVGIANYVCDRLIRLAGEQYNREDIKEKYEKRHKEIREVLVDITRAASKQGGAGQRF